MKGKKQKCPECGFNSRNVTFKASNCTVYTCSNTKNCGVLFKVFPDGSIEVAKVNGTTLMGSDSTMSSDMAVRMTALARQDKTVGFHNSVHQGNRNWGQQGGQQHGRQHGQSHVQTSYPSGFKPNGGKLGDGIEYSRSRFGEIVFTVDHGDVEEGNCEHRKYKPPVIHIPQSMWRNFIKLADKLDTEWLALLKAAPETAGVIEVVEFYFPPQVVTGGHVDVPDGYVPQPGTNGAIHSHVKMQAFWSSEDNKHWNWPFEVVINARGEYSARVRHQMSCGCWSRAKTELFTINPEPFPELDAVKEAIKLGEQAKKAAEATPTKSGFAPVAAPTGQGSNGQGQGSLWQQGLDLDNAYEQAMVEAMTGVAEPPGELQAEGEDEYDPARDISFLQSCNPQDEVWMCDECGELYPTYRLVNGTQQQLNKPRKCGECNTAEFTKTTYGSLLKLAVEELEAIDRQTAGADDKQQKQEEVTD